MKRRSLTARFGEVMQEFNYQFHLIQHGIAELSLKEPWLGLPLGFLGILVLWVVYWSLFPFMLGILVLSFIFIPFEKILSRDNSQ